MTKGTISRIQLRRLAQGAEQFQMPGDSDRAVEALFAENKFPAKRHITAVVAEILAMRKYPRSRPHSKWDGIKFAGTDFVVRGRRYQVKSITFPTRAFLVNKGPHNRKGTYRNPPHVYVFVRMASIDVVSPEKLAIVYDLQVVSRDRLFQKIVPSIRKKKKKLPLFAGKYIRISPEELGFRDADRPRGSIRG